MSEQDWTRDLDAGLREGFGPDEESGRSVLARIEARVGSAPRLLLRDTPGQEPVLQAADLASAGGRYQIHGEIARGGVGIVLKGRDIDLGREVAMKVIRPEHAESAEILQRFVEEAQIGGQLQHPGIVPVYELGMQADRRAFFTMKLIKGQTLAALLKARRGPDDDRRRFLSVFEQICQTVSYAHARGVVHRDLKPANVMVGSFGEVQVVDWGFAKVMAHGGVADERRESSVVHTVRSGSESRAGSVLGTPAFMPPEQALGQSALVDERSDVFALGAILCEILTGKPPYARPGSDVFVQAAQADLDDAFARLDGCGADDDLVTLCRRCLEREQASRPANAGKLADAVGQYFSSVEERARAAEIEAETAKVKAVSERKARKLTLGLAATIVLAILVGGGSLLVLQQKRREQERRTSDAVSTAKGRAERLRGDKRWADAIEAAQNAVRLAKGTVGLASAETLLADIRSDAGRWESNRQLVQRLADIRMQREEVALRVADEGYAAALGGRSAGDLLATGIAEELAAYLDEWIWIRAKVDRDVAPLLETAKAIDPDPWRNRLRDAARAGDRAELLRLAADPDLAGHTPNLLARHLAAAGERETAVGILRQAQQERPDDFWLNYDLGFELTMLVPPQWDEAIGFFRVALASAPSIEVRHQLGIALFKTGRYDQAIATWRDALADGGDLHLYDHVIEAHEKSGRLDGLLARYRDEAEQALTDPVAHYRVARASEAKRVWDDAVDAYRRAADLRPDDPLFHVRLGYALAYDGDVEAGLVEEKTALGLDPECTLALHAMSLFHVAKNEPDLALERIDQAIAIDPYDYGYYVAKGLVLFELKRPEDVPVLYDRSIRLNPENADAYVLAGQAQRQQGELDRAIESFEKATRMPERVAEGRFDPWILDVPDERTGGFRRAVCSVPYDQRAYAYASLGQALATRGRAREAVAALREALRRMPKEFTIKASLADALLHSGDLAEAAPLFDDVYAELGLAYYLYFGGFCRLGMGQLVEGERRLREFVALPFVQDSPLRDHCVAAVPHAVRLAQEIRAIQAGERKWTSAEEQALGIWVTEEVGFSVLPARLFEDLLTRAPELAGEPIPWPQRWHYAGYGVVAALLAGRGNGRDAAELTPEQRAHWRRRALEWMKLDLSLWRGRPESERNRQYREWLHNGIYALARNPANLADLPPEEADAWRAIWDEIRATLGN